MTGEMIPTGLKTFDEMLGGGLPKSKLICIYGLPLIGKSWLSRQICFHASRLGKKSIYIDTEKEVDSEIWSKLKKIFTSRWPDVKPESILLQATPDIFSLGELFGIQFTVSYSEEKVTVSAQYPKRQGELIKSSFKDREWIVKTPIYKTIKEGGYSLVVIDSFSAPIRPEIPSATQNLGARASIQRPLLQAFRTLGEELGISVLITAHVSKSPQEKFDLGKPWGGDDMYYYVKYVYNLLSPVKADYEAFGPQARRIMRVREPLKMPETRTVILQKDYGFISPEEFKP